MDPCSFIRIIVSSLSLKIPEPSNSTFNAQNNTVTSSSSSSYFCKIKLKNFPAQTSNVSLVSAQPDSKINACFTLEKAHFEKLLKKQSCVKIEVFSAGSGCGFGSGRLVGAVVVNLGLNVKVLEGKRACLVRTGWVGLGRGRAELFVSVLAEPDPRFVFEFGGEPECSPQVFQVNGNVRQAVFTCKFGVRNNGDRNRRSRSLSEADSGKSWLSSLRSDKEKPPKERKGWSITIHDLSGSPVAMASMVTPFVPSKGTDRVSKANPGAWLILLPGRGTWTPWGRLEAWLEVKRGVEYLGYRFDLLPDPVTVSGVDPVTLSSSTISTQQGGKFSIDITGIVSPMTTPSSSFDSASGSGTEFESGSWAHVMYQGFVMSSMVGGRGKCSKPEVEVGVQHVACNDDAAAFVALAAAMDLSMDACTPFSSKLRKELRQEED